MWHLKKSITLKGLKGITSIIFFFSILFHSIIVFKLFPTNISFKYQVVAQQYLNNTIDDERLLDVSPLYFYVHIAAQKLLKRPNIFILWLQIVLIMVVQTIVRLVSQHLRMVQKIVNFKNCPKMMKLWKKRYLSWLWHFGQKYKIRSAVFTTHIYKLY